MAGGARSCRLGGVGSTVECNSFDFFNHRPLLNTLSSPGPSASIDIIPVSPVIALPPEGLTRRVVPNTYTASKLVLSNRKTLPL